MKNAPQLKGLFCFGMIFLAASCGKSERYLPNIEVLFSQYETLDSTKAYHAFAEKMVAANHDLQSSQLYLEAAAIFHQEKESEQVVALIHRAIDNGMANPKILSKYKDLGEALHTEEGKRLLYRLDSIQKKMGDVSHFSLEMESMNLFWPYFERAKKNPANAKAILKEFIFDGPRELKDFYVVRYLSTDNMYGQMINAAPDYYEYLKQHFNTDSMHSMKAKTTRWMKNFKDLYPQAVFPKVFVVPGILNSGGTATEMGMFVGGDMYGKSDDMPIRNLSEWQKGAIMEFDHLPKLTIHELMHFQQSYDDSENGENVIGAIIAEGVCDFMVELASGEPLDNPNLDYLDNPKNMAKILEDLKTDAFTEDYSRWLYNGGINDRPFDLGYTMGYLISKSYYENHDNKSRAIYELLNTNDFASIVRSSKYGSILGEL